MLGPPSTRSSTDKSPDFSSACKSDVCSSVGAPMVNVRCPFARGGKLPFKLFPFKVRLWSSSSELELSYMYNTDTHRLELDISSGNARGGSSPVRSRGAESAISQKPGRD